MNKRPLSTPVSGTPQEYPREYYEESCQGYDEFKSSHGNLLPRRLSIPLKLAKLHQGMIVIDIGCGRGEMLINSARAGARIWGLDAAPEALVIAKEILSAEENNDFQTLMAIQQSDAAHLPFADESVDLIFMLDIVEHLHPEKLRLTFIEARRVLRPNGRLIIHTMPNLWYYRFGYPIYRLVQRLRGKHLPRDPRTRWDFAQYHVNEQNPFRLGRTLAECKFRQRIWLYPAQSYQYEGNPLVRFGMEFLTRIYPFRWIFCNDIFAIGVKPCA